MEFDEKYVNKHKKEDTEEPQINLNVLLNVGHCAREINGTMGFNG